MASGQHYTYPYMLMESQFVQSLSGLQRMIFMESLSLKKATTLNLRCFFKMPILLTLKMN